MYPLYNANAISSSKLLKEKSHTVAEVEIWFFSFPVSVSHKHTKYYPPIDAMIFSSELKLILHI